MVSYGIVFLASLLRWGNNVSFALVFAFHVAHHHKCCLMLQLLIGANKKTTATAVAWLRRVAGTQLVS